MLVIWVFFIITVALFSLSTIKIFILIFFVRPISAEIYNVAMNVFPMSLSTGKPIYEIAVSYKYEFKGKSFNSSDRKRDSSLIKMEKIKEKLRVGDNVTVKIFPFSPEVTYFFDYKFRLWMHIALSTFCGVMALLIFRSL